MEPRTEPRTEPGAERGSSRGFPDPGPFGSSAARGRGEQRREKLDRFGFVGSGQRLEPRRLEPDLTIIGCRAQRHQPAAAA
jgi:hypothetical protein